MIIDDEQARWIRSRPERSRRNHLWRSISRTTPNDVALDISLNVQSGDLNGSFDQQYF